MRVRPTQIADSIHGIMNTEEAQLFTDLISACLDAAKVCDDLLGRFEDGRLVSIVQRIRDIWQTTAASLQTTVDMSDGPAPEGAATVRGSVESIVGAVRGRIASNTDRALLEQIEHICSVGVSRFDSALNAELSTTENSILRLHHQNLLFTLEKIREQIAHMSNLI